MKNGAILLLSLVSTIANAGGAVVSGGRGAVLVCSQADMSQPTYQIVLNPILVGKLTVETAERSFEYPLSCTRDLEQPGEPINCEHEGFYTIQILNNESASVFNNRGHIKNLTCEVR